MPSYRHTSDESRAWSPYRKEEIVVTLPDDTDGWDPVTKIEYFSSLEEAGPADSLILEARRQSMDVEPLAVDVRSTPSNQRQRPRLVTPRH